MKELHKHTLKEAIQRLPKYLAPSHIWQSILERLGENNSPELQSALSRLPQYQAPEKVWAGIAKELSQQQPARQEAFRSTKVRSMYPMHMAAAVVGLLMLFGGAFWLQQNTVAPAIEISAKKDSPTIKVSPAVISDEEKYRQFDFWIGKWEVFQYGTEKLAGHSLIESILDGKVIRETYSTANSNYAGTSLNKYNPTSGKWEQYWVDNSGLTLHILGQYEDNKMTLQDAALSNRITWHNLADGTVRQVWEQSTDSGKNWTKAFDGHYKKAE